MLKRSTVECRNCASTGGRGTACYFARIGTAILLLCAGDKTTQLQDIERAKTYLEDYRARSARPKSQKRSRKDRKRPV